MTDINDVTSEVKIQYPTLEPESLQRSITQIKELLEDPDFYNLQQQAYSSAAYGLSGGGASDCCGNIDGGQADTNYGGIFCDIDGGSAGGSTNTTP